MAKVVREVFVHSWGPDATHKLELVGDSHRFVPIEESEKKKEKFPSNDEGFTLYSFREEIRRDIIVTAFYTPETIGPLFNALGYITDLTVKQQDGTTLRVPKGQIVRVDSHELSEGRLPKADITVQTIGRATFEIVFPSAYERGKPWPKQPRKLRGTTKKPTQQGHT